MTDTETDDALWLCDREPRAAMRALAAAYRQLAARVATLEAQRVVLIIPDAYPLDDDPDPMEDV